HDARLNDALRQILVRCPDTNLLHPPVRTADCCRGSERVVRFELHHRPDRDSHRRESVFEGMKLIPEHGIDALSRLVTSPKLVAKRLDDVVRGHTDVGTTLFDQLQHAMQHAADAAKRSVFAVARTPRTVEVPKELVGPVDEVEDHLSMISEAQSFFSTCAAKISSSAPHPPSPETPVRIASAPAP